MTSPLTTCAHTTDPALLSESSSFRSYRAAGFVYPQIRVFYQPRAQASLLPQLPLLVFVHGLGGSVAQLHPLLASLVHVASCLAVDLPGCGRSDFAPSGWDAYAPEALVALLDRVIEDHAEPGQRVVLIGHSMGTSLCARLASSDSSLTSGPASSSPTSGPAPFQTSGPTSSPTSDPASPSTSSLASASRVVALVAICPAAAAAEPSSTVKAALLRALFWTPAWVFNLWRSWDQRGGVDSPSVRRFVGPGASLELRTLQARFNGQSRTPVWLRMAYGCVPAPPWRRAEEPTGGLAGPREWGSLNMPVFLVGGEADTVTSPAEMQKIGAYLGQGHDTSIPGPASASNSEAIPASAGPVNLPLPRADPDSVNPPPSPNSADSGTAGHGIPARPERSVMSVLLPAPANHTLPYHPCLGRTLAGLVSDFLAGKVDGRLDLGWQLQRLSRDGKWDVKNLDKWKRTAPVSGPVGVFRALKTLREADDEHCPAKFAAHWASQIGDVVDISRDAPVYDPRGLERAGVGYHKFPTVSKVPPSGPEVSEFIGLVDRILAGRETGSGSGNGGDQDNDDKLVGVHCHYGFNRTGYFIVCYLVERCGMTVQAAIDAFAAARPDGIRHPHFLDRLFVRYGPEPVVAGSRDGDAVRRRA